MILYVVATPIGNLKDISQRALGILKEADLILAEDTRRTRKLLNFYKIQKPLLSYHQHSKLRRLKEIKDYLVKGKNLALVCDAGTPGISDPAGKLIDYLYQEIPGIRILPIPGPTALTAGLSVSGFPADRFLFAGFPPKKRKRQRFFQEILLYPGTIVIYESPYRLLKTLMEINQEMSQQNQKRKVLVIKEISKEFESSWRGKIEEVIKLLELEKEKIKGEFIIILGPKLKNY